MTVTDIVSRLEIDNIYIYVADAVRWDALPDEVAQRGKVLKSVAASIHSPTSFASIVTGRYLPSHGVTDFDCRVPDSIFTLFDIEGYHTKFVNSIGVSGSDDPIYSVLDQSPSNPGNPIHSDLEPFVIMERGQGGHAPYSDFDGTATEYFDSRKNTSVQDIKREYYDGVERDAVTFLDRLNHLQSEGLLEDTLIVYTSDHGELLGEGGMFGHNGPIRPELVFVPTVFIHPGLCDNTPTEPFGHTKLLPTVLDALDIDEGTSFDDPSLGSPYEVAHSFYDKTHELRYVPVSGRTKFDSVWFSEGGYVFPRSSVLEQVPGFVGSILYEPMKHLARKHLIQGLSSYISGQRKFGSPSGDPDALLNRIDEWKQSVEHRHESTTLTQDAHDRLEDLGYID